MKKLIQLHEGGELGFHILQNQDFFEFRYNRVRYNQFLLYLYLKIYSQTWLIRTVVKPEFMFGHTIFGPPIFLHRFTCLKSWFIRTKICELGVCPD